MDPATGIIPRIAEQLAVAIQATPGWDDMLAVLDPKPTGPPIYYNDLPLAANGIQHTKQELVDLRPYALIWTTDGGLVSRRSAAGGGHCVNRSGELLVRFERNVPMIGNPPQQPLVSVPPADAERSWENMLSRIIDNGDPANPGLIQLGGDPSYLSINSVSLVESTRTSPEHLNEIGDAQRAYVLVTWESN